MRRKMIKQLLLLVMLLGTLLLSACGGAGDQADTPTDDSGSPAPNASAGTEDVGEQVSITDGSYTRVSPDELRVMLEDKNFPLVNTHIPFEGDIPGTNLSIPYNEIDQNLGLLPADKDARIVLYCRTGRMSTEAAGTLVRLGYTNVWELAGGMVAWEDTGFPIERT
jgi:phage shock protein E